MTAAAVLPRPLPAAAPDLDLGAAAYQRVLHQLVRRELRVLAEVATWADPADLAHTAAVTRHADLLARVLLHHHATERELLWPALVRSVPAGQQAEARALVDRWTPPCARIDGALRDLATAARQWAVAGAPPARDAFALACLDIADAVDGQTAEEEAGLLPLLAAHLPRTQWRALARSARSPLAPREQLLVLGMALEDLGPTNRARLLAGLPPAVRLAWRLSGRRRYRAAVVGLRGAPPAR